MDCMDAKRSSRLTVGVLPLLAACYTQRPLTVPVPAVGTQIVASVTDSGVVAMSNALGPGAVEVEGVIAAADASAWELQLVRVDYRGEHDHATPGVEQVGLELGRHVSCAAVYFDREDVLGDDVLLDRNGPGHGERRAVDEERHRARPCARDSDGARHAQHVVRAE